MNKKKLIKEVASRTGFSFSVSKMMIDCLLQTVGVALKRREKVSLRDFGTFYNMEKPGRRYYHIPTGEIKTSSEGVVVKFAPSRKIKERLNSKPPSSHGENDGGRENPVPTGRGVCPASPHSRGNDLPVKPASGKENTGQRVNHRSEEETAILSHDGYFLFDHFLGESEHKEFPSLKVPRKGTPVLVPHVDKVGATTGVMEPVLRERLTDVCKGIDGIEVVEDVKLPILNRNYSYHPDFCLFWKKNNLYIDIEIDEPYDIVGRQPTHYLENGDNLRDRYFIRNGWCVIRYAEQQVKENLEGIVNHIKRVLRWLTDESSIKMHEDTLAAMNRWSYGEAKAMSVDNVRERYLDLPDCVAADNPSVPTPKGPDFVKPDEDILPEVALAESEGKWETVINEMRQSGCEHCLLTRTNGYQWVYVCNSLDIQLIDGVRHIFGQSPFGIDLRFPLDEIGRLVLLRELFSSVHWESGTSTSLEGLIPLKEILFDAIANGKPIWVAYHSNNSGYGTRFLSNLAYSWHITHYFAPHIGLGHCRKYSMQSLSHFHAYCSNRKEFRCFAADCRVKELKVLNCSHVYFLNEEYENSFAHLVMSPYENNNGNAFFENADEILRIMPQNEFKSFLVQGNLANLQVMKGEISKAVLIYQQFSFDCFIAPSLTWGEMCMSDIHSFINLCKEHLNDCYFYEGLNANVLLHNFEEVLRLLTKSSWMRGYR